jgi:hypothetical protein
MADYALTQLRWDRIRPSGQPAEDVMVNTFHWQCADGGLSEDDASNAETHITTWVNAIKGNLANGTVLTEARHYNMPATAGPVGDPAFTTAFSIAGTGGAGNELPPQAAISHTLRTAIRRRWGRIYLGGISFTTLDHGRVNATAIAQLANGFADMLASFRGDGTGWVVWHRASWTPQDFQVNAVDDVNYLILRRRFDTPCGRAVRDNTP